MKKNNTAYNFQENWITEKITLNNGVQKPFADAEVKAYDIFRNLGVPTPLAQLCSVSLYRDEVIHSTLHDYTMVETINDKAFMKKHFGDNWTLWEVESGQTECKRSYPNEDVCDTENMEKLSLNDVDQTEMINYFVGERITSHTDSACLGESTGNNYYVAKWYPLTSQARYTYIPSGVDQTFKCWYQYLAVFPQCNPVQECFQSDACKESYLQRYEYARDNIYDHIWPCVTTWHKLTIGAVGAIGAVTMATAL